jgi:hypothetical protein
MAALQLMLITPSSEDNQKVTSLMKKFGLKPYQRVNINEEL